MLLCSQHLLAQVVNAQGTLSSLIRHTSLCAFRTLLHVLLVLSPIHPGFTHPHNAILAAHLLLFHNTPLAYHIPPANVVPNVES